MPRRPKPGPHPDPPADLHRRDLCLREFSHPWFRIHYHALAPLFFGTSGNNRFDAPAAEFGVLYVGKDFPCAFVETLGHNTGLRFVTRVQLSERALARVEVRRVLRLVDLTGNIPKRLGADSSLANCDISVAKRWSLALHNHPQQPDGIYYRARGDSSRYSAAIFDRAKPSLRVVLLDRLDAPCMRRRVAAAIDRYDFALI